MTKRGGPGRGKKTTETVSVVSFAADTGAKTGVTERSVRHDTQIAESIPEDVREQLHDSAIADAKTNQGAADTFTYLRHSEARRSGWVCFGRSSGPVGARTCDGGQGAGAEARRRRCRRK